MNDNKFQINEYLSLELKNEQTYVYVNDEEVSVCKHIAVKISSDDVKNLSGIDSIDELSELYRNFNDMEENRIISPDEEFQVHCSNIQAWAEQGYDTRLLHSNIGFPLLKKLAEVGDPQAKKIFKEEIAKRYHSGSEKIQKFLATEGYLNLLAESERNALFKTNFGDIFEIERLLDRNLTFVGNVKLEPGIELYDGKVVGLKTECCVYKFDKIKNLWIKNLIKIPWQIQNLKHLKKLYLGAFKDVCIPDWIGSLSELEHLDLHNNNLEEIPESFGNLYNLKSLDLGSNKIKTLPKTISRLQNLEQIYLYHNRLEKFPIEICSLDNIKIINIVGNNIRNVPIEIHNLKELYELDLELNPVKNLSNEVFDLPKLKSITINSDSLNLDENIAKKIKEKRIRVYRI